MIGCYLSTEVEMEYDWHSASFVALVSLTKKAKLNCPSVVVNTHFLLSDFGFRVEVSSPQSI